MHTKYWLWPAAGAITTPGQQHGKTIDIVETAMVQQEQQGVSCAHQCIAVQSILGREPWRDLCVKKQPNGGKVLGWCTDTTLTTKTEYLGDNPGLHAKTDTYECLPAYR